MARESSDEDEVKFIASGCSIAVHHRVMRRKKIRHPTAFLSPAIEDRGKVAYDQVVLRQVCTSEARLASRPTSSRNPAISQQTRCRNGSGQDYRTLQCDAALSAQAEFAPGSLSADHSLRPQHLQILIVSIGIERVRAVGEHRQKDMGRRESRLQKLRSSGGKALIGRGATMATESDATGRCSGKPAWQSFRRTCIWRGA